MFTLFGERLTPCGLVPVTDYKHMSIEAERLYHQAKDRQAALNTKRIVAEVSKTWPSISQKDSKHIAAKFEEVIEVNRGRGYVLESWQLVQNATLGECYETIIAVFVEA